MVKYSIIRKIKNNLFLLFSFICTSIGCSMNCSSYVYYPETKIYNTPADMAMKYKELYLTTEDNVRINAWYVPSETNRGTVLFCHGNGGNISTLSETIKMANGLGLNIMVFDYRGYGKSDGTSSENGTYLDAERCYNYLTTDLSTPPEKIIVWGRSLGGAVAVDLAAKQNPALLIVESSFTSLRAVTTDITGFKYVTAVYGKQYNSIEKISSVKCPVMIIHSSEDDMIGVHHGKALLESVTTQKDFLEITGGHNTGFINNFELISASVDSFLKNNYDR